MGWLLLRGLKLRWGAFGLTAAMLLPALSLAGPAGADGLVLEPFLAPAGCAVLQEWYDHVLATYPEGALVPLKLDPTDEQLAMLGLPPRAFLQDHRFPEPTMLTRDGRAEVVDLQGLLAELAPPGPGLPSLPTLPPLPRPNLGLPALATYAGAGCFGIRPGALLLNLNGGIAICSMAHVYGSPGAYDISTAGHCGKNGEVMTVVAAFGNRDSVANPVLLDFGKVGQRQENGIGADWALIDVLPQYQNLVSPTMCVWAGPRGTFTATGSIVSATLLNRRLAISPQVTVNPDPALALGVGVVHYGHGLGSTGAGTPRVAADVTWASTYFMFAGAIAPGDSGSGANTATGQAAGIITHLVVDPTLRTGIGIGLGTRVTQVPGTLANGQLLPYPVPAPLLP